jgi:hypothetical protein
MKKLGKLQVNPEKLMQANDLFTLRGGYGGSNYWICLSGSFECGCITTVTTDKDAANFYCGWFTGCNDAWGPFTQQMPNCFTA